MRHLKKFESYENYKDVFKSRREERDYQQITQMLNNAMLFQRMKLIQDIEKLDKRKKEIENAMDNDPYVKSDPNPETNSVVIDYQAKISQIDAEIAIKREKISSLIDK